MKALTDSLKFTKGPFFSKTRDFDQRIWFLTDRIWQKTPILLFSSSFKLFLLPELSVDFFQQRVTFQLSLFREVNTLIVWSCLLEFELRGTEIRQGAPLVKKVVAFICFLQLDKLVFFHEIRYGRFLKPKCKSKNFWWICFVNGSFDSPKCPKVPIKQITCSIQTPNSRIVLSSDFFRKHWTDS